MKIFGKNLKILRWIYNQTNELLIKLPRPIQLAALRGISYLPFDLQYPKVFMIEPTNICNGLCPLCPVGLEIDVRRKGHLRYDKFVTLVDEIKDFAKMIIMNFAGEPILNPDIGKLAQYAESNGIPVVIGTNGTLDKSEDLVRSGVSEILFALDGATDETYRKYRTYKDGRGFDTVLENLRRLVQKKRELKADRPSIILQFVVMKDNEHEMDEVMRLGTEIGVDAIDFKPVTLNEFFTYSFDEMIDRWLPSDQRFSHYEISKNGVALKKPPLCSFAFHETEILWNGDVTTCCYDYDGNYVVGNIFKDGGFKKVWKSKRYRELRRKIIRQELEICKTCGYSFVLPTRIHLNQNMRVGQRHTFIG